MFLTFQSVHENLKCLGLNEAVDEYFHVVLFMLYNVLQLLVFGLNPGLNGWIIQISTAFTNVLFPHGIQETIFIFFDGSFCFGISGVRDLLLIKGTTK